MCLSTIYKNEKQDSNVLCQYVATITVESDRLIFVDVMGETTAITGRLVKADLTAGTVIVATD